MGLRSRLFALTYNRLMASGEKAGLAEIRAKLLARACGDVLEVGAGTGLNLTHYAGEVNTVTVTEPDTSMKPAIPTCCSSPIGTIRRSSTPGFRLHVRAGRAQRVTSLASAHSSKS